LGKREGREGRLKTCIRPDVGLLKGEKKKWENSPSEGQAGGGWRVLGVAEGKRLSLKYRLKLEGKSWYPEKRISRKKGEELRGWNILCSGTDYREKKIEDLKYMAAFL